MVLGEFLSYDPYGIMFRKDDPQLAKVVNDTFQILAEDGEIERQYKRWFLRKLPAGHQHRPADERAARQHHRIDGSEDGEIARKRAAKESARACAAAKSRSPE